MAGSLNVHGFIENVPTTNLQIKPANRCNLVIFDLNISVHVLKCEHHFRFSTINVVSLTSTVFIPVGLFRLVYISNTQPLALFKYLEPQYVRKNCPPPVDPVECGDGVVAPVLLRQRLHPYCISVGVDASVANHQLHSDDVTHQWPVVVLNETAVYAVGNGPYHKCHPRLFPHNLHKYDI